MTDRHSETARIPTQLLPDAEQADQQEAATVVDSAAVMLATTVRLRATSAADRTTSLVTAKLKP
jgi:hypothetical protein